MSQNGAKISRVVNDVKTVDCLPEHVFAYRYRLDDDPKSPTNGEDVLRVTTGDGRRHTILKSVVDEIRAKLAADAKPAPRASRGGGDK